MSLNSNKKGLLNDPLPFHSYNVSRYFLSNTKVRYILLYQISCWHILNWSIVKNFENWSRKLAQNYCILWHIEHVFPPGVSLSFKNPAAPTHISIAKRLPRKIWLSGQINQIRNDKRSSRKIYNLSTYCKRIITNNKFTNETLT